MDAVTANERELEKNRKIKASRKQLDLIEALRSIDQAMSEKLPMEGRATLLPFRDTAPGSVMNERKLALPGIAAGAWNALTAPSRAMRGELDNPEEEAMNVAGTAMLGAMPMSAPRGALAMNVWHGSPHQFPATARNPLGQFDSTKIGTGEGAQAYGHGLYLAENPNVAKEYKFMEKNWFDTDKATYQGKPIQYWYDKAQKDQQLAFRTKNKKLEEEANASLNYWESIMLHEHPEAALQKMTDPNYGWPEATKYAKSIKLDKFKGIPEHGSSLYKVDLPDEKIEKMLDWDKPLSQQPKAVQEALSQFGIGVDKKALSEFDDALLAALEGTGSTTLPKQPLNLSGAEIYKKLGSPEVAAQKLQQAGIPGIKYFDAFSRDAGKGTRNFVVFPGGEDMLTILERNGVTRDEVIKALRKKNP